MWDKKFLCFSVKRALSAMLLVGCWAVQPAFSDDMIDAVQSAPAYVAGEKLAVSCEISFDDSRQVTSLLWRPSLPVGWSLDGTVTGDGAPEVDRDFDSIVFWKYDLNAKIRWFSPIWLMFPLTQPARLPWAVRSNIHTPI